MRSIIDNPACWGAWEEPGVADAPATAAGEAASCDLAGTASSGAAMITFRAPIPFRPSAADMANADTNRAMRSLLDAVSGAALGEAWDRVVRDHIKYGTGVAAMGVVDDGIYDATTWPGPAMLISADASLASPVFCGTAHVTLGAPYSAVRLEHGVGRQMVACDLPANTTRRDVVRLLREFANAIEQGGDS